MSVLPRPASRTADASDQSPAAVEDRRAATALGAIVVVSAIVRSVVSWKHSTPRFFPDEYIYTALGRSIAQGNLEIRGATSHFPAILEPVLAAPIWGAFSVGTAYHLVQVENAAFASAAAVPVYLLGRWLGLSRSFSLFCAVFGLALPELTIVPFTVSDLVGYPLIITTVFAGLHALDAPTTRRQWLFLALATLSSMARVEYAVVVPAYLVAAVAVERRQVFRRHRIALTAMIPASAAVVVGGVTYYFAHGLTAAGTIYNPLTLGHWFLLQAFLLTISAGVVIVPGAVAAMARPSGRRETVFALFVSALVVLVIAAASEPAAASGRFKERYLFELVPLTALAFGLYLRRRPLRPVVIGLAAVIAIAVARLPLSSYASSIYKSDSEFLFGVSFLQDHMGTGSASLLVALLATAGCIGAVLISLGRFARAAIVAVLLFVTCFSVIAVREDIRQTRDVRSALPSDLSWVDHAGSALTTAIATTPQPSVILQETLFWNPSIQREVVLPGASATDAFNAPTLRIGSDGTLLNVRGAMLVDGSTATALFANARPVRTVLDLTLWRTTGTPRLRLLIADRIAGGWLGNGGSIQAWPDRRGAAVMLGFKLSLPRKWPIPVHIKLGRAVLLIRPGRSVPVECRSGTGALALDYSSPNAAFNKNLRRVIAKLSAVTVIDVSAHPARSGPTCSAGRA